MASNANPKETKGYSASKPFDPTKSVPISECYARGCKKLQTVGSELACFSRPTS